MRNYTIQLHIDCFFIDDPISRSGSQENVIYNIRRISTKSTVTEQLDSRFATQWLWYWQDSFGMWREYPRNKNDVIESNVCLSDDIEKKFVEGIAFIVIF